MTFRRLPALVVPIASIGLVAALLPAMAAATAQAAPTNGWRIGDCFAKADVPNDEVVIASRIDCAKPHLVQILGSAPLPRALTAYSYAELRDQDNTAARKALVAFSEKTCAGARIAPAIWPTHGKAVAEALAEPAASVGGGVLPALEGVNYGWVLPDEKSYRAGDRTLICVLYAPKAASGSPSQTMGTLTGDARLLDSRRALPSLRTCYDWPAGAESSVKVSCAAPHDEELVAFFAVRLPVDLDAMTDELWAPLDKSCASIIGALVGARRTDLQGYVDVPVGTKANAPVYAYCLARQPVATDDSRPKLPPGSIVGLGRRPLAA